MNRKRMKIVPNIQMIISRCWHIYFILNILFFGFLQYNICLSQDVNKTEKNEIQKRVDIGVDVVITFTARTPVFT